MTLRDYKFIELESKADYEREFSYRLFSAVKNVSEEIQT